MVWLKLFFSLIYTGCLLHLNSKTYRFKLRKICSYLLDHCYYLVAWFLLENSNSFQKYNISFSALVSKE